MFQHLKDKFGEPPIDENVENIHYADINDFILSDLKQRNDVDINGNEVPEEESEEEAVNGESSTDFTKENVHQVENDKDEPCKPENITGSDNQKKKVVVVVVVVAVVEVQNEIEEAQPKKKKKVLKDAERISGEEAKHPMKPPCTYVYDDCRRGCKESISEEMRKKIHARFWTQNYNDR